VIGKYKILGCLFICFSFNNVQAEEKSNIFSVDIGKSYNSINIYRFGLRREFDTWFGKKIIPFPGYFESSLIFWKGLKDEIYGIALSPVLVAQLCNDCKYKTYIEGGIRVSFISNTEIDDKNMSSSFQFEDRVGFIVKMDNIDIHIRYMHYSNAGIVLPNNGINMFLAGVAYKF